EDILSGQPLIEQSLREQQSFVSNPQQTLSHLIVQLRKWKNGIEIPDFWWGIYNWYLQQAEWREALFMLLRSLFYVNDTLPLETGTSRKLYGTKVR
ncbi:hypothetical protein SMA37_25845, partial [Escherichia coli]|uniref:hypothetical protein n=1 Tax=Escherichia coli TaxID=562 RepID=UPI00307A6122